MTIFVIAGNNSTSFVHGCAMGSLSSAISNTFEIRSTIAFARVLEGIIST
jgi:hypothetical protein